MSDLDSISLDYLLVADSADVVNGKLYLLGGGWDSLKVPQLPGPPAVPFSVAVGIDVPWSLTNQKLRFSVDVLDADGGEVVQLVGGEFEVGRPPGLRAGTPQRFQSRSHTAAVRLAGAIRHPLLCRRCGTRSYGNRGLLGARRRVTRSEATRMGRAV